MTTSRICLHAVSLLDVGPRLIPEKRRMILEIAVLNVRPGQTAEFEASFRIAQRIIAAMHGYLSHELSRCVERDHEYVLLVRWETIDDHEVGFRQSSEYQEWRRLLHHYYEPPPSVAHYERVL